MLAPFVESIPECLPDGQTENDQLEILRRYTENTKRFGVPDRRIARLGSPIEIKREPVDDSDHSNDLVPALPTTFKFRYRRDIMRSTDLDRHISEVLTKSSRNVRAKRIRFKTIRAKTRIMQDYKVMKEIPRLDNGIHNLNIVKSSVDLNETTIDYAKLRANGPLNLDNMPPTIMMKILCYVFPVSKTVRPWFKLAMSTHGVRGWSANDENITYEENVDVAYLRVNKACYEMGRTILYGSNHFLFKSRSDCCVWWIRHIGDHNVKELHNLTFRLNTGWRFDRRNLDIPSVPSEQSHEQEWFTAIAKIQELKVKLKRMEIYILEWSDLRHETRYTASDKNELRKYRKMIIDRLTKFREVKVAKIFSRGEAYISPKEVCDIALLMQQPGHTLVEEPARIPMDFVQTMSYLKAEMWVTSQRKFAQHSCEGCQDCLRGVMVQDKE